MERTEQINELAAALAKAQSTMAAAAKDSDNPFFRSKYADLASCWAAWRPAGPPQGLALMQFATAVEERLDPPITVQADGDRKAKTIHFIQRVSVKTVLVHSSGQSVSETLTVLVKDDSPQATLLGETYCRRGGMSAIIGIAPEDDDGNSGSNHEADFGKRETASKPQMPPCPECGKTDSVIVGKPEYGGGFVCYTKKEGCGHKWQPGADPKKSNGKAHEVAAEHGLKTGADLEAEQHAFDGWAKLLLEAKPEKSAGVLTTFLKEITAGRMTAEGTFKILCRALEKAQSAEQLSKVEAALEPLCDAAKIPERDTLKFAELLPAAEDRLGVTAGAT